MIRQVEMALEALYNVIHNNAGVETQCNGHFKLLFSFFRFQGAKKLQMLTLKVHKTLAPLLSGCIEWVWLNLLGLFLRDKMFVDCVGVHYKLRWGCYTVSEIFISTRGNLAPLNNYYPLSKYKYMWYQVQVLLVVPTCIWKVSCFH